MKICDADLVEKCALWMQTVRAESVHFSRMLASVSVGFVRQHQIPSVEAVFAAIGDDSRPATRSRPRAGGSAGGNGRRSRHRRSSARVPVRCRGTLYREAVPAAAVTDDAGRELAELLAELVAFPTESTTPNLDLIRWFADHAESNGGRVTVLNGDVGRANLLASFGPQIAGGLMLSGHTDVVPAGTGWATDPYSMTRVGDALHGRGTADMKGFIAAMIRTITQFRGVELRRPLHIALSFDEEIGCVGVRQALEVIAERDDVSPEVVVIGEPTMMRPRHSHMGKLAYEIVCTATAAHSSLSHTKPSAITIAARLLNALDDLQQQYRPVGDPEVTFNCGSIAGGSALERHRRAMHLRLRDTSHGRSRPRHRSGAVHARRRRREGGSRRPHRFDRGHRDHPLPGAAYSV